MTKKYVVSLSVGEREKLQQITKSKAAAHKRLHSQILLKADEGENGPAWIDERISESFDINVRTVERVRQRLVEQGLDAAINRAPQVNPKPRKIAGEQEAHLVALACSEAPEGRGCWTLQLLADKMIELKYVDTVSRETVRQVLKKTRSNRGKKKSGVFHRKQTLSSPV